MLASRFLIAFLIGAFFLTPAFAASDREDDIQRIDNSAEVLQEIMSTPDKGIPQKLLESAKCIAIIPGEKKAAFMFGGRYGKGLAICKTAQGWSAPLFLTIGGGSFGFQIGASSTDIVMLVMNDNGMKSLLSDKFKLGGDASVAAGPVGRHVAADTDLKLTAEILTYSRSKGVFAGVSLDGAVVEADHAGDRSMYGSDASRQEILDGKVRVPRDAETLIREVAQYTQA
jgi:lipid-binding SYLF domain-containing protein